MCVSASVFPKVFLNPARRFPKGQFVPVTSDGIYGCKTGQNTKKSRDILVYLWTGPEVAVCSFQIYT